MLELLGVHSKSREERLSIANNTLTGWPGTSRENLAPP